MYIIIGKIENREGKLEALKIIDNETQEIKILSYNNLRKKIIDQSINIKGMKRVEVVNYYTGDIREHVVKEKGNFTFTKVPALNGDGTKLINPADADLLVVYGWSGFRENKKYYCYNYKGETVIYDERTFLKKVEDKKINGASIISNGKLVVSRELEIEVE